jgi:hypothetical protein
MNLTQAAVGGALIGLALGILIGAALIAGQEMNGMSVGPSLILAIVGGVTLSNAYRTPRP